MPNIRSLGDLSSLYAENGGQAPAEKVDAGANREMAEMPSLDMFESPETPVRTWTMAELGLDEEEETKRSTAHGNLLLDVFETDGLTENTQVAVGIRKKPNNPVAGRLPLYDSMAMMARPFISLSTKLRLKPIDYVSPGDGALFLTATSRDGLGLATIADADVLMFLITTLIDRFKRGMVFPSTVSFQAKDLLARVGKSDGGRQYALLRESLNRLCNTEITTNISPSGGSGEQTTFCLLEAWHGGADAREWTVTIPDWLACVARDRHVLRLSAGYADLPMGYERWLYRVTRKHAGVQAAGWKGSLPMLWRKSASGSTFARFKFEMKSIVVRDPLPDYHLGWLEPDRSRGQKQPSISMTLRDASRKNRDRLQRTSLKE